MIITHFGNVLLTDLLFRSIHLTFTATLEGEYFYSLLLCLLPLQPSILKLMEAGNWPTVTQVLLVQEELADITQGSILDCYLL
jgi:hypothetical protein